MRADQLVLTTADLPPGYTPLDSPQGTPGGTVGRDTYEVTYGSNAAPPVVITTFASVSDTEAQATALYQRVRAQSPPSGDVQHDLTAPSLGQQTFMVARDHVMSGGGHILSVVLTWRDGPVECFIDVFGTQSPSPADVTALGEKQEARVRSALGR